MSQPSPSPMDVVQDLIRPTEEAKVAIEARPSPSSDADSETWSGAGDAPPVLRRKILAVVSHLHADGKHEHGWGVSCEGYFTIRGHTVRLEAKVEDRERVV
ncbi:hypothetical protein C8Q78DRAFT_990674 [Trametes maxima]|nr:hypothetical protein C8Q78DRAFT_990674 [Trametes maxima]